APAICRRALCRRRIRRTVAAPVAIARAADRRLPSPWPAWSHSAGGVRRRPHAGRLDDLMGLFNKLLHAGAGRKLKNLESIPPVVGAFDPETHRLSASDRRAL